VRSRNIIRLVLSVAGLLLVPLLAMRFTDEVNWTPFDFAVAGVLLLGTGLAYEFAASRTQKVAHRIAIGAVLLLVLLVVWAHLAVGIF
jgi:hypothetical protein